MNPGILGEFEVKPKQFLGSLGFQGLFTVDITESKGVPYFGELNLRIGCSGIVLLGAGVDIALMAAEILCNDDKSINYNSICNEVAFARERPILIDLIYGFISWKDYKEIIRMADYRFIYSEDDRKPYYAHILCAIREYIKKHVKK